MYPKGNLFIPAPHGKLEAILKEPSVTPKGKSLVAHPHPLGGGTMHNKVVFRTAAGLTDAGFITLRFNFRGVGLSTGTHDEGRGEKEDVITALNYLTEKYPEGETIFAGFSFGSRFGLEAVLEDKRVSRLISIGSPVDKYDYSFLYNCKKPILFIHGDKDEFGSLENLRKLYDRLDCGKELVVFENCGHFFDNHLQQLKKVVQDWASKEIGVLKGF
ncbi:MAG: alpha/beta fold hydrolase [Acidobacteria bacterium]|jgi:alpha/beta superfamily hydrolase|nr:MAG: alpha/beta fold hydrolase [Acidobacteriota bacterium]GIU82599.1 MAG: alpha/beta hydrolase [Pyrinomonadaceae bacterium]